MSKEKDLIDVQTVRLLDVFVVAPFLFYASTHKSQPEWVKFGLFVIASATLIYNGRRYLEVKSNQKDEK